MSEPRRKAVRIDVNTEVAVHLPDHGRELRLLLVDISESGARLRTPLKLPARARIAFSWVGPSRERIPIVGHVVAARMADAHTIDYGVDFAMPAGDRDRLARDLAEVRRSRARSPRGAVANAGAATARPSNFRFTFARGKKDAR